MNPLYTKTSKILSILLVAWQLPMLFLWYLTYEAVKSYCYKVEIFNGGGYKLVFNPELVGQVLWQNVLIILALVICFVLPLLCMIFLLRKKGESSIPVICMLGVSILSCIFMVYWFNRPFVLHELNNTNHYTLQEFMFFRYTIPEDIFHTTVEDFYPRDFVTVVFPLLQEIKFLIITVHTAVSGILLALGIAQVVRRRKQEGQVHAMEESPISPAITDTSP